MTLWIPGLAAPENEAMRAFGGDRSSGERWSWTRITRLQSRRWRALLINRRGLWHAEEKTRKLDEAMDWYRASARLVDPIE